MDVVHIANGWVALVCAAGLGYIVLSRRVHEGLTIKIGLVLMIIGLLTTVALTLFEIETWRGLSNAGFVTRLGLLVVIVGYALKARRVRHPTRRRTDWGGLDRAR